LNSFQWRPPGGWLGTVAIVASVIFGIESIEAARTGHVEWGAYWLTVPVLAVATATLIATLPRPARLIVQRQDELGLDDLIFFLVDDQGQQIPRDFLLQLHVAVINVGGRNAVLSTLNLTQFFDASGSPVAVPELPMVLSAQMARQTQTYGNQGLMVQVDLIPGPYVLEPDDVITLRFRARRGIDWQPGWTLNRIQQLAEGLARPIASCNVRAVYRRGHEVLTPDFRLAVRTVQQAIYADALTTLTGAFTHMPQALPLQNLVVHLE